VYLSDYQTLFKNKTKSNFDQANQYVEGIVLSELNNIERINETLGTQYHQLHHFISDSNWNARSVMDQVARDVSQAFPKDTLTGLLIDESGWVKKGDKSVGVGHQYCGNVGKTANSQVSVFGCLSNSKHASIVDCRLYLPESWTTDSERCDQAGIPPNERTFKTKLKLGIDIIKHQMSLGINFDYVGGDGFYGHDASFAREIDDMGLVYVLDIHPNQQIFLEKPELLLPERKYSKGRLPKRFKVNMEPINANKYIGSLSPKDWEPFAIRLSAKGVLEGQFHFKKVFILVNSTNTIETRLLIVSRRKTANGEEYKYSFTNASFEQYTKQALVCMQAQRFFIEHSFKEQKQILGMDQFQTRKWKSLYHQIALNMMVGCFLLKEKLLNREDIPILSARDIMDFLVFKFYKEMTEERILANLKERHRKRLKDINYCYSKK
jgi:SRSO17 transposase